MRDHAASVIWGVVVALALLGFGPAGVSAGCSESSVPGVTFCCECTCGAPASNFCEQDDIDSSSCNGLSHSSCGCTFVAWGVLSIGGGSCNGGIQDYACGDNRDCATCFNAACGEASDDQGTSTSGSTRSTDSSSLSATSSSSTFTRDDGFVCFAPDSAGTITYGGLCMRCTNGDTCSSFVDSGNYAYDECYPDQECSCVAGVTWFTSNYESNSFADFSCGGNDVSSFLHVSDVAMAFYRRQYLEVCMPAFEEKCGSFCPGSRLSPWKIAVAVIVPTLALAALLATLLWLRGRRHRRFWTEAARQRQEAAQSSCSATTDEVVLQGEAYGPQLHGAPASGSLPHGEKAPASSTVI